LFFGLLIFGVSWQTREAAPVMVELWNNLPSIPEPPAPPPKVEEPKPEIKAEPKPVKIEQPKPVKADILLKDKKAKLKEEEEKKKIKEREEQALKEKIAQEMEMLKDQQEREKLAQKAQAERSAVQAKLIDEYKRRIKIKILSAIVQPPDLVGNPQAEFEVVLLPTGEVLSVTLKRSSGQGAYDVAVERAIQKAQPLPLPPEPTLFKEFRELNLKFRLNE
jgi:colicin import membrane protein